MGASRRFSVLSMLPLVVMGGRAVGGFHIAVIPTNSLNDQMNEHSEQRAARSPAHHDTSLLKTGDQLPRAHSGPGIQGDVAPHRRGPGAAGAPVGP